MKHQQLVVWKRWIRMALAIVVVVGLVYVFARCIGQLGENHLPLDETRWHWIAISAIAYSVGMLMPAIFWTQVIWAMGLPVEWSRSLAAYFASQLGKYVPGKAMVVVIRADMIRGPRVDTRLAVIAVFVETLTWIAVAAAMGCGLVFLVAPRHRWLLWIGLPLGVVSLLATLPPMMRLAIERFCRDRGALAGEGRRGVRLQTMLWGWVELGLGWALLGFSTWAVLNALPNSTIQLQTYWLALTCATLSVVVGFVSLIPGGLGVRELVVIPLLATQYTAPQALMAAILLRLIWLIVDVFLAAIMRFAFSNPQPART